VVINTENSIIAHNSLDYIYLTDMLRAKDGDFFISDWLRNKNTIEFMGIWETVPNPNLNYGEFATIRNQEVKMLKKARIDMAKSNPAEFDGVSIVVENICYYHSTMNGIISTTSSGFNTMGYTCEKDTLSIHAIINDPKYPPNFANAKFMLVACSAFINYPMQRNT